MDKITSFIKDNIRNDSNLGTRQKDKSKTGDHFLKIMKLQGRVLGLGFLKIACILNNGEWRKLEVYKSKNKARQHELSKIFICMLRGSLILQLRYGLIHTVLSESTLRSIFLLTLGVLSVLLAF